MLMSMEYTNIIEKKTKYTWLWFLCSWQTLEG